ncbi:MAG: aldo/keto reductase [Peptostreptococcaceae bacterium]
MEYTALENKMEYATLSNGLQMPKFGLGTFRATGEEATNAFLSAINEGYKMIDTAKVYENEECLKEALEISSVDRKDLWITSKVWTTEFTDIRTEVLRALEATGAEYFDLYLLHWPRSYEENAKAWAQMEEIYKEGLVKAIGVSNFQIHHLDRLLETATIKPMINQVEAHPNLPQYNLQDYCAKFDCRIESYCSFMKNECLEKEELVQVAKKHNVTVYEVILAWLMKRDIIVIPMSTNKEEQAINLKSLELKLDDEDMELIKKANKAKRYYPCPDNHKF